MVCVVILAGGKGERFWPKSRESKPKQFTDITGDGTMLQLTYERVRQLVEPERIFILTGNDYREVTLKNLPDFPEKNIILEPEGRNTAPCIGLAALILEKKYPGSTMVVLPADHLVKETAIFTDILRCAVSLAEETAGLITIGIRPTRPETGYGYLELENQYENRCNQSVYRVARFVEKPNKEKAQEFLADGGYLWNAGMFVWKTSVIIEAFSTFLPDTYRVLTEIVQQLDHPNYDSILKSRYSETDKISIDYGIMEKAAMVYTVSGDIEWDDVGSWKALERIYGTNEEGNLLRGKVITLNSKNTIADTGERLVALIGVEDLIVVDTEDITYICHKDKADMVRELLQEIRSQKLEAYL